MEFILSAVEGVGMTKIEINTVGTKQVHFLRFICFSSKIVEMTPKERFYKVFSNLPINIREEVILVIDDDPVSWRVAKLEIDNDTPMAKKILEKLIALEVI